MLSASMPVGESVGPLGLAQPAQGDVEGHRGDERVVLDAVAVCQRRHLGLLVQICHCVVLAIPLRTGTNTLHCQPKVCLIMHLPSGSHLIMNDHRDIDQPFKWTKVMLSSPAITAGPLSHALRRAANASKP